MLYTIIKLVFSLYTLALVVRIIASWIPSLNKYAIFQFLCRITDPYLNFFRRFIPPLGPLDLSPIVGFFVLQIVERLILSLFQ